MKSENLLLYAGSSHSKIQITPNEIDFGEIENGKSYNREITLQNIHHSTIKEKIFN